jgi:hypothetical protein
MTKDKKNFWFTIDRKVLSEALATVIPIIPSRGPYPIIFNVRIETKDGKLTLLGTDLDTYVKETVTEVNIGSDEVALLPARKLAGILMEIKGDKLTFKTTMKPGYRPGYKAFKAKVLQTKTGVIVVYFTDSWEFQHSKPVTAWTLRPKSKQIRKIHISHGRIDKLTYVRDATLRVDAFARLVTRYAPVDDDYADQAVPVPEAIHILNGSVTSKIPVLDAEEYPRMFEIDWSEPSIEEPINQPKPKPKPKHKDEPKTQKPKEPWQMTQDEFSDWRGEHWPLGGPNGQVVGTANHPYHRELVEQALAEGKPVPPEVLADYPDLVEKIPVRVQPTTEALVKYAERMTKGPGRPQYKIGDIVQIKDPVTGEIKREGRIIARKRLDSPFRLRKGYRWGYKLEGFGMYFPDNWVQKPKPKNEPKDKTPDTPEPQNAVTDMVAPETIDKTLDISEDKNKPPEAPAKENIMEQEEDKKVAMDGEVIALVGDIVVIRTVYKGKEKIDVRRLYENGDGALHPSKQGIRLTAEQWAAIIEAIQAAIAV